eukprot:Sspe_Gene.43191::Locus_21012_Transcript_1_2_Confidence_1.000_Length_2292::g.43191::m.43191
MQGRRASQGAPSGGEGVGGMDTPPRCDPRRRPPEHALRRRCADWIAMMRRTTDLRELRLAQVREAEELINVEREVPQADVLEILLEEIAAARGEELGKSVALGPEDVGLWERMLEEEVAVAVCP